MIFDKTLVEKRIAEERHQRSQMKFESFTKRKISELQKYIANFETDPTVYDPNRGLAQTPGYVPANLETQFESVDRAKELISTLKLENKIMKETIDALKAKTEDSQAKFEAELRRVEAIHGQLLAKTREEAQATLDQKNRQIGELVDSKKYLTEQLETLGQKYMQLDQNAFEKLEAAKAKSQDDLKKARAEWDAQMQVKFKDWKEKTKRQLKESTIKGLEPEIERILKKGEAEKEKMRAYYEGLLKTQDEGMARKVADLVQIERDKLANENAILGEKQRKLLAESFEKEMEAVKRTHEMEVAANKKIFEREKSAIEGLKGVELASLKERLEKAVREAKDTKSLWEEKLKLAQKEFESRLLDQTTVQQREQSRLQNELKDKYQRMGEEAAAVRVKKVTEDLERKHKDEIDMLVNKFAEDLSSRECGRCATRGPASRSDAGGSEVLKTKLTESEQERGYLRQKLALMSEKVDSLKLENAEIENDNFKLRETLETTAAEKGSLRVRLAALEEELRGARDTADEKSREISRLRAELYEIKSQFESVKLSSEQSLKSYYEREMDAQQQKFDAELDGIQRKITEVMEAKERTIAELRREAEFKNSLVRKYEEALERQRHDFLSK